MGEGTSGTDGSGTSAAEAETLDPPIATAPQPGTPNAAPKARSGLRAVAMPTEHGGWGLTAEPILMGMFIAPSVPGLFLGLAAMVAFLAHTPLRLVLVDRYRDRTLDRTKDAAKVLAIETAVIVALVAAAFLTAERSFWLPAVAAAPLVGVALWFDTRSKSRRLLPELAGTIGMSSVVAMMVLAADHPRGQALTAWMILAARAVTSIPHVRALIAKLHGRPVDARTLLLADLTAVVIATAALVIRPPTIYGVIAIVLLITFQRVTAPQPTTPKVIGLRQMLLGLAVVVATAVGFQLA